MASVRALIFVIIALFPPWMALASPEADGANPSQSFYRAALNTAMDPAVHFFGETRFLATRSPLSARLAMQASKIHKVFQAPLQAATRALTEAMGQNLRAPYRADAFERGQLIADRSLDLFNHLVAVAIYAHALEMAPRDPESGTAGSREYLYLEKSLAIASRGLVQTLNGAVSYLDPDKMSFDSLMNRLVPSLASLIPQTRSRDVFIANMIFARARSSYDGISPEEMQRRQSSHGFSTLASLKQKYENWQIARALRRQSPQPVFPYEVGDFMSETHFSASRPLVEVATEVSRCEALFFGSR